MSVRTVAATACVALVIATSLMSCAMERHREQIRQGFLARGLHRNAFLKEWGLPSRTFAVPACNPALRADPYATSWPVYEVWEYQARATCLTFDGVRLLFWKTGTTDCEPTQPCEPEGIPAYEYPTRQAQSPDALSYDLVRFAAEPDFDEEPLLLSAYDRDH